MISFVETTVPAFDGYGGTRTDFGIDDGYSLSMLKDGGVLVWAQEVKIIIPKNHIKAIHQG